MKSILLTSTALVAFAGAAAADGHTSITTAFSATLGYNDTENAFDDNEEGFYWVGDLDVTATATLDNGLTAGAFFNIEVADNDGTANNDGGLDLGGSDFVVSLESETAGLFFGDTATAPNAHWDSAGDMEADGFTPDGDGDTAVLRGDVSFGGVDASVSYLVDDAANDVEQLAFGASAAFGAVSFSAFYQEEITSGFVAAGDDFNEGELYGVSASGTFVGATVTVAYAEDTTDDKQSTGIKIAYPFGPVTATAYYVDEAGTDLPDEDPNYGVNLAYASGPVGVTLDYQDDQGTTKLGLDGSYDVGNGLEVFAGYYSQDNEDGSDYDDEFYVGAEYDLGGGAALLVTYAEGADNEDDEIGANDYQEGTTIEVSFAF